MEKKDKSTRINLTVYSNDIIILDSLIRRFQEKMPYQKINRTEMASYCFRHGMLKFLSEMDGSLEKENIT